MRRKRPDPMSAALRINAGLLAELTETGAAYRELLDEFPQGADPGDNARWEALSVASMATSTSLHVESMRELAGTHGLLPPALEPRFGIIALRSIAESAVILAEDGASSPLVLDAQGLADLFSASSLASWIRLVMDGPVTEDDLRPQAAFGETASHHDQATVHEGIRAVVVQVVPRYYELHSVAQTGGEPDDATVVEAIQLAYAVATVLRTAAVGGDELRFAENIVYALRFVLAPLFESLVEIGVTEGPLDLLDPEVLRAMLDESPHMPALLA